MILSILIPTINGREREFNHLHDHINGQITLCGGGVEIVALKDNRQMTIGEKRNRLYEMANGRFSVSIDDDDWVSDSFVHNILRAATHEVDCIGYREHCTRDGHSMGVSDISLRYKRWDENKHGFKFIRTPFNKVPILTSVCKKVKFPDIRFGEDHIWSKLIYPHLEREAYVPRVMYQYRFQSGTMQEKYGVAGNY